ncbi:MAG: 1-deoxy-D-xylulose-5-phosphate synthase [Acutalibacteraceae bacterium]|nr:1-deoxy-D-xylulose-5-phosphate synthase [Acutalibacteraceae bacterium]
MEKPYLEHIKTPADLADFTKEQLDDLCNEIREKLMMVVSHNGGHLASNLGTVELTVALEKAFYKEDDSIVWDVGHQCYTHKLLTGRADKFDTIRTEGGLSGFPKREESNYDAFNAGHSSTSISAAYGIARAKNILGKDGYTIAVIGDGALTGGMAYEGLNNAGRFKKNFIVVLNDNKMSISKNVGSMARYLNRVRFKPGYIKAKARIERVLLKIPVLGKPMIKVVKHAKTKIRYTFSQTTLFEDMGFHYYGPINGHDISELSEVFETVKNINGPVLVHVVTKKGKGYAMAENKPNIYHGISAFDIETGEPKSGKIDFSFVFGNKLVNLAKKNKKICAITAAMESGTGLSRFATEFKPRFFDTGIAEEHAVTFAGGLAAQGALPFFAVYSTFLQRGIDQIIHDIAMQNLHVVFAVDRAGLVGEDGETHQGVFDVALLNPVPNIVIYSPTYFDELEMAMDNATANNSGPVVIRYPRGTEPYMPSDFVFSKKHYAFYGDTNSSILLVTYGKLFANACKAYEKLKDMGINICILKLNRIKPIPEKALSSAVNYSDIFFFEEGMATGGVGEHFFCDIGKRGFNGNFKLTAIDNTYVKHAKVDSLLTKLSLDSDGMVKTILKFKGDD